MTDASSNAPWHFPPVAFYAAVLLAPVAAVPMLLWMLLTGMHAGGAQLADLLMYLGIAMLIGAAWLFGVAVAEIRRAPSASRTAFVRGVGFLSYLLAAACAAIAMWLLAMIVLF